jgi:hypothetical protein
LETVLGGLAAAGFKDQAAIGQINSVRELLSAARDGADAAVAVFEGGHAAVSETVNAVPAADSTEFYRDH